MWASLEFSSSPEHLNKGDLVEKRQLEYRAVLHSKEGSCTMFDHFLCQYYILCNDRLFASRLRDANATISYRVRSVFEILDEDSLDNQAWVALVRDILTWLRVFHCENPYWMHLAQLILCVIREERKTLSIPQNSIHVWSTLAEHKFGDKNENKTSQKVVMSNAKTETHWEARAEFHEEIISEVRRLIPSIPCGSMVDSIRRNASACPIRESIIEAKNMNPVELSPLLLCLSHPSLCDVPLFAELNNILRYQSSLSWLEDFRNARQRDYERCVEEFSLSCSPAHEPRKNTPQIGVSEKPTPCYDPHDVDKARNYAQYLLQGVDDMLQQAETLLFRGQPISSGIVPEYVARVTWGHEWNNYNRTHYDSLNPPPKVARGYKFNIFLPNLPPRRTIKFEKTPTVKGWEDTVCHINFRIGHPYADLQFEIRNLPMNTNPHKGYKCVLERGSFSLYFNLRSLRYKRI